MPVAAVSTVLLVMLTFSERATRMPRALERRKRQFVRRRGRKQRSVHAYVASVAGEDEAFDMDVRRLLDADQRAAAAIAQDRSARHADQMCARPQLKSARRINARWQE
jgi:hypothetical protein